MIETRLTRCPTCAAFCCQSMITHDRGRHERHPFVTHACTCENGYVEVKVEGDPDALVVFTPHLAERPHGRTRAGVEVVDEKGFEPSTSCLQGRYSPS